MIRTKLLLLVDNTPGFSLEVAKKSEKHRLQAQCYALALIRQGFKTVEAHFIRVERTSKSDLAQPQEVTYRFTAEDRATLEKAVLSAYEARKG